MNAAAISSVEMVCRLVGFDTTSRGSNLALIEFVRDYLDAPRASPASWSLTRPATRPISTPTVGPAETGGIMLSGHTDVVPVDGQDWHSDPFNVLAKDDRLYGRGTADMKSFIAVVLALLPNIAARPLRIPIHLAFSYDEEVGCRGARRLVAAIGRAAGPAAPVHRRRADDDAAGDRPQGQAQLSLPGARLRMPFGADPSRRQRDRGGGRDGRPAQGDGAKASASSARSTPISRPPYTTIQTGVIHGGTALNIVPKECSFDFEFRLLPGDDPEAGIAELRAFAEQRLLPDMRAVRPEAAIAFEELSAFPGLATPDDAEITRLVASLTGANGTGKVAFGTEGGLFQQAGIQTIVCGPGSIEQAHKPDEFIDLDQIAQCEKFIGRLFASVVA